jgi:hypothetical protein
MGKQMNGLHPYQTTLLLQKSKQEEYLKQLCWMPEHPAESRQKNILYKVLFIS